MIKKTNYCLKGIWYKSSQTGNNKMTLKICIVSSEYNKKITDGMYKNAVAELNAVKIKKFDSISVPGAFEIPVAISKLIKKYDGFIAIGCIIKGETANFDLISRSIPSTANDEPYFFVRSVVSIQSTIDL